MEWITRGDRKEKQQICLRPGIRIELNLKSPIDFTLLPPPVPHQIRRKGICRKLALCMYNGEASQGKNMG